MKLHELQKDPKYARARYELQWDVRFNTASALEEARIEKGWSQGKLAKAMKAHPSAISRAEAGRVIPSLQFLNRAARAMGMKVEVRFLKAAQG